MRPDAPRGRAEERAVAMMAGFVNLLHQGRAGIAAGRVLAVTAGAVGGNYPVDVPKSAS